MGESLCGSLGTTDDNRDTALVAVVMDVGATEDTAEVVTMLLQLLVLLLRHGAVVVLVQIAGEVGSDLGRDDDEICGGVAVPFNGWGALSFFTDKS